MQATPRSVSANRNQGDRPMKSTSLSVRLFGRLLPGFCLCLAVLLGMSASAVLWTVDGNGDWTDDSKWDATHPNGSGAVADFGTVDLTADRTVNLDAARTVGTLTLGDAGSAPHNGWIFADQGYALTFNAGGDAALNVNQGTSHVFNPDISLSKGLVVTTAADTKVTLAGDISGSQWIRKAGTGTLVLSGSNSQAGGSYSFDTIGSANAGTLELRSAGALSTGAFRIGYGSSITLDNQTGGTFVMANNITNGGGSQVLRLTGGDFDLGGTIQFNNGQGNIYALAGTTATISGTLASTGTKLYGPGTIEVVGTVSGSITGILPNGILPPVVGMGAPFGAEKTTLNGQYGLTLYAIGGLRTFANSIALSGYGNNTFTFAGTHDLTFSGTITDESGGSNRSYTMNTAAGLGVTFSSAMPGNRGSSQNYYRKTGAGLLVFSGTNSYTFRTHVDGGVLRANDGVGLPTASYLRFDGGVLEGSGNFSRSLAAQPANAVDGANQFRWDGSGGFSAHGGPLGIDVNGGGADNLVWASTANFLPNGATLMFGSPYADNVVTFQDNINLNGAVRTIQVVDNPSSAADQAVLAGNLTGTGGLNKTGDGVLELTGANSYTGATLVSAGVLLANSTTSGQGDYTISAGATLGGTGWIGLGTAKLVDVSGTVSPGNSIGTLTIGTPGNGNSVVFQPNSSLHIELAADGSMDQLIVYGSVDLTAFDTLVLTGEASRRTTYDFLQATGGINGWFDVIDTTGLVGGGSIVFLDNGTMAFVGIPEPTSGVLLALAGLALARRRRLGTA